MQQQYRASCDRCQHAKVKCSQAKPTCQRCAKKALSCVYSPVKTIGRPRKRPASISTSDAIEVTSLREDLRPEVDNHPQLASPAATNIPNRIIEHTNDTSERATFRMALDGSRIVTSNGSDCHALEGPLCPFTAAVPEAFGNLFSEGHNALGSSADLPLDTCPRSTGSPITWNTSTSSLETSCPFTSNGVTETTRSPEFYGEEYFSTGTGIKKRRTVPQTAAATVVDCYLALLQQLTHVETEMAFRTPQNPPPIDLILRNVNDLREIKDRIFMCEGHSITNPLASIATKTAPCLSSPRPVLLILCLLSQRVIELLEDLFRRATTLAGCFNEEPQAQPSIDSRRMKRTMRSLIDYTSSCSFPEANQPLQVGAFEVSEEVKTKALRWILHRRILGLLAMVNDINLRGSGSTKVHLGVTASGILFGKHGSNIQSNQSCANLAEDLHSRVETLLGRVDLTC